MITKPEDFHLQVGDIVHHIKEQEKGAEGVITHIDFDSYFFREYGVTTCLVLWNGCREVDVQWSNKLVKQEETVSGWVEGYGYIEETPRKILQSAAWRLHISR